MKNFNYKLLLASTAILAMGAVAVNAETQLATTELYAYLSIVDPASISMMQPLQFGIVSNLTENQWLKIDAADGTVTGNATQIDNFTTRGVISVSDGDGYAFSSNPDSVSTLLKLVLPTEIRMTRNNGTFLCGYVDEITATNNGIVQEGSGSYTNSFRIGGKFTAKAKEGEEVSFMRGNCSGHGTVTLVVDRD